MSYNGSGTFVINTAGQPVVSGTVISSTAFNALTADLATGLSTAITKDGQTTPTANIPMGNNKITNLAVGTAATDAANLSQVQSTTAKLVNSISGADTITGTMSPNLAAYATGQMFYFIAAGDNTGAVTLNIDSLGAKSVTRDGSVALAAGDIKSGEVVVVVYDGTRFQVVSQINSSGNATFANVSITSALNVGGVATFSAGTAAAPSITTSGDTNNGIFFPATDVTAITTAGSERLRVDASGNLALGSTPSAYNASFKAFELINGWAAISSNDGTGVGNVTCNAYATSTTAWAYKSASSYRATRYSFGIDGVHAWYNSGTGTAGNAITFTQAMTLDADGRLALGATGINGTSNRASFVNNTTAKGVLALQSTSTSGYSAVELYDNGGTQQGAMGWGNASVAVTGAASATYLYSTGAITFLSGGTSERARITSGGNLLVGTTTGVIDTANFGVSISAGGAFLNSRNVSGGSAVTQHYGNEGEFRVMGDGDALNTNGSYGTISDARLKQDIVDAPSQWDDIKAVRFRKYRMKSEVATNPDAPALLGVVAQELEEVCPGLVSDANNEDGTTTKTVKSSILLMKAAVALQEAMTRIEELEAKVAALEAK